MEIEKKIIKELRLSMERITELLDGLETEVFHENRSKNKGNRA